MLGEEREVLGGQLVLQRLGRRGYHDPVAREDGRDKVGQGLSGACPGLDDEVAMIVDCSSNGLGHRPLPVTRLSALG